MATIADTMHVKDRRQGPAGLSHGEYRRARRHSWLVRGMKFLFPLVAVLVMAGFFWASIFNAMLPNNFRVDRSVLQGGKLIMSDPVLTGQNAAGAIYRVTARRAIQALSDPNNVKLENIRGSFPLSDGKIARLEAKSARLDRSANVITFDEPFRVETQAGVTAQMQGAQFDLATGKMVAEKPVDIRSDKARIVAESMRMSDKGKTIEFNHRVKMTVQPSAIKPVPEEKAK